MMKNYPFPKVRPAKGLLVLLMVFFGWMAGAQTPCNQPLNVHIQSLYSDGATIVWDQPDPAPFDGYDYFISPINQPPSAEATVLNNNVTLTGLPAGVTQYFYVRSNCSSGFSSWRGPLVFKPNPDGSGCPVAPFDKVPEETFTPQYLGTPEVINTDAYAGEYCLVNIIPDRQYIFETSKAGDYITIANSVSAEVIAHGPSPLVWNHTSTLSVPVRYYISSNASCGTEAVERIRYVTGQVIPSDCTPPNQFYTSSISNNGAILHWSNTTSEINFSYDYYYSAATTPPTVNTFPSGATTFEYQQLSNLTPNTTYYYWVRMNCSEGMSAWVLGGSFTTQATAVSGCVSALYGQDPPEVFEPACTGVPEIISTTVWAGNYSIIKIQPNKIYTFTSSAPTDFITIRDNDTSVAYASGTTPLSWSSGANTTEVKMFVHLGTSCGNQNVNRTTRITCQDASAGCNAPSGFAVLSVTANSASLGWTAASPIPSNGYQYYLSTANVAPTAATIPSGTSGNASVTVNGLNANTTYYIWVRSNCTSGQSAWVFGNNFTTVGAGTGCTSAPFGQLPVEAFTPACFGNTEVMLTDALAGQYSVVNILPNTQYTFSSSVQSDYLTITNADASFTFTAGTTPVVWNSGINTGTIRYYLHGGSNCASNTATRTRYIACTTTAPVCNAPNGLSANNITVSGATLTWAAVSPTPSNGYQVYLSTSPTSPTAGTAPSGSVSENAAAASALSSSTTYYFWVRSDCGASQSAWSVAGLFTTLGVTCGVPTGLNSTAVTSSSAALAWTAVTPTPSDGYQVYLSTSATAPTSATIPTGSFINNAAAATTLASNTTYYFWVRANCGSVQSAWSAAGIFTTAVALPGCTVASFGQFPDNAYTPSCNGSDEQIVDNAYAGEYSLVNIVANRQYTFQSDVETDYITITNQSATVTYAHGTTPLVWNSGSTSGVIRYYFHTNASCGEQNQDRGRYIRCQTPPPCNAPAGVWTTGLTYNSATLGWATSFPSPSYGYQYYVSTSPTAPTAATLPTGSAATNSAPLTGLLPTTTYYCWVRANCGGTPGAWTANAYSFTTPVNPQAGCTTAVYGQFPEATFTPACNGSAQTIVGNAYAGEFCYVAVVTNRQYTFSSSVSTDYITITGPDGATTLAHGPSPLSWNSGAAQGSVRYYLHADADCGNDNEDRIRYVACASSLGEDANEIGGLEWHPNPVTDRLYLSHTAAIDAVSIVNMLGQTVRSENHNSTAITIDFSDLAAGVYLVKVLSAGQTKTIRIVRE